MMEVSAGIVVCEGRILCVRRGDSKFPYLSHRYEFPGGKIEEGETPESALIREFGEELNLDIGQYRISQLSEVRYRYPDFDVTLYPFLISMENIKFDLLEHEDFRWLFPSELREVDWIPADLNIVTQLEDIFDVGRTDSVVQRCERGNQSPHYYR